MRGLVRLEIITEEYFYIFVDWWDFLILFNGFWLFVYCLLVLQMYGIFKWNFNLFILFYSTSLQYLRGSWDPWIFASDTWWTQFLYLLADVLIGQSGNCWRVMDFLSCGLFFIYHQCIIGLLHTLSSHLIFSDTHKIAKYVLNYWI